MTVKYQICTGSRSCNLFQLRELRKTCFYCCSFSVICHVSSQESSTQLVIETNLLAGVQSPPSAGACRIGKFYVYSRERSEHEEIVNRFLSFHLWLLSLADSVGSDPVLSDTSSLAQVVFVRNFLINWNS